VSHLTLTFLGQFQLTLQDQPAIRFETDKVRALLAYLVVEGNQAHSRSTLAALLWPGYNEENARTNLRHALHQLRQTIGDATATPPWLLITRQTLQFNPAAPHTLDVQEFSTLLNRVAAHAHPRLDQCASCLQALRQAADLYRGDFLAGFAVNDSAPFEEWRRIKQEQLHLRAVELFQQLARYSETVGDNQLTRQYAARQLELEPWREEAHRQIMRTLARSGQRNAALAQYQLCCRILAAELDTEPEDATTALYEQIRTSLFPGKEAQIQENRAAATWEAAQQTKQQPTVPGQSASNPLRHDWGDMPTIDVCQGRALERSTLERWLLQERSRLIAVLGMGGVGKTTLTAKVVQEVAAQFNTVIWRSLLNAPPLREILREWLQILSHQTLTTLPARLDEQFRLLLDYLRQQRVLLVLDNLESILQPGSQAGELRPDYHDYAQLIQLMGASNHQSCLLLTSREQPQAMTRLLGQQPAVRLLPLTGLDVQAGHTILQMHGLTTSDKEAAGLIEHYSGNPLALQIVANTIVNLFAGDVQAFQQEGAPVFDNIRQVLDDQFARLSVLEREILLWLAIEREPVTAVTLRRNLLQPPTQLVLLETLRSLQHRSLLEMHATGFTMQNVVIEYATEYLIEQICRELERFQQTVQTRHGQTDDGPVVLLGRNGYPFLNRLALIKTQAKEYVGQSQVRLLLQPIAERLQVRLGKPAMQTLFHHLLDKLRTDAPHAPEYAPGYAAGNLLNLMRHLNFAIADYNFAQLAVWQADLRRTQFAAINFTGADLAQSVFTLAFDLRALTFTPAKQVLLAGILEGDLCLWRAADGQLHHAFRYPSHSTTPVVFSRDGQSVAAGGIDFTVCVWSTEQGKPLHTFFGHQDKLYGLAFSPDGQQLASSSRDGTVRIWDLHTSQLLHTLYEHANAVTALTFSLDGKILAGGGGEHLICLWDTASGALLRTLHGHTREIECVAFAPDDTLLVSGAHDGTIRVWDWSMGRPLYTFGGHPQIIRAIVFHPDGHTLASGGADRIVRLWDLRSGHVLHALVGHKYEVNFLAFSRDGQTLASGSIDRTIQLWDTHSGRLLDRINGHAEMVRAIAVSPDGQWLASSGADGMVRLWDLRPWKCSPECNAMYNTTPRQLLGHTEQVYSVAFSPDGRLLASGAADYAIYLWDVATGKALRTLHGHQGTVKAIAFSPDGKLVASGSADHTVRLWSLAASQPINILTGHTDDVGALAFSPDGATLLSGSLDYSARLWSVGRGETLYCWRDHGCSLYWVGFTRDGRRVITTQWDFTVKQWEARSGQPIQGWNTHGIKALGASFSPDGEIFACVTAEQAIELRHFATGELIRTLRGHRMTVLSIAFHPTQPLLGSSSWDGAIKLWDLRSGICLQTFQAPGPYAGMNITGVTGISAAQKAALKALGAVEEMDQANENRYLVR